ncbi:unnamed protein product, partial [Prorocentrum cordatum]
AVYTMRELAPAFRDKGAPTARAMATESAASLLQDLTRIVSRDSCEASAQDVIQSRSIKDAMIQKWAFVPLHQCAVELKAPWSHIFETILDCLMEPRKLPEHLEYLQHWQQVAAGEADEARQCEIKESTKSWRAWVESRSEKSAGALHKWTEPKAPWEPMAPPKASEPPETAPAGETAKHVALMGPQTAANIALQERESTWQHKVDWAAPWFEPLAANEPALPPILGHRALHSCRAFSPKTGLGESNVHPGLWAQGPAVGLAGLASTLNCIERGSDWPVAQQCVIFWLQPKPKGGTRNLGLLPELARVWGKIRRPEIQKWQNKNPRAYEWAANGRSAERTAWMQGSMFGPLCLPLVLIGAIGDLCVANPRADMCLYFDDLAASTRGDAAAVAAIHAKLTDEIAFVFEQVLQLQVSRGKDGKTVVAASHGSVERQLGRQSKQMGIQVVREAAHLGVTQSAARRRRVGAQSKRIMKAKVRSWKIQRVKAAGGAADKVVKLGIVPSELYGTRVQGAPDTLIAKLRQPVAAAFPTLQQGQDADPAVLANAGPIVAWASAWQEATDVATRDLLVAAWRSWCEGQQARSLPP